MPRGAGPHQKSLYAIGVAFAAYGTAVLPPEGNGFIAVFVAAIALGIWRPDIRECFETRSEDLLEVVKLGVFLVFGAIFTFDTLFEDGWAAVAIVAFTLLVARPVAVFVALAGARQVDTAGQGVHRVVRAQGRGDHDVRACSCSARAAPEAGRIAEHRGAGGVRLGDRARADRPPGIGVDGAPRAADECGIVRGAWTPGTSPRSTFSRISPRCFAPTTRPA